MPKIKSVKCHPVSAPVERPFTSSRGWLYKTRGSCIVEIETNDGLVGWGECYGPALIAKSYIDTQFSPRLIGRDPFDVEVIWEDLYNRMKDYGSSGMVISAMSGIDIALWDIIGKESRKPIHKLIGG
ncbi:MAG: mandelate racemase/muconate lactonizing enzyme family protein, partial [Betaproteobacteria bacterium]|nr:mandelate racemase/muconate lactonizing enzyme family protein [Betaproteobacteria bacterium]